MPRPPTLVEPQKSFAQLDLSLEENPETLAALLLQHAPLAIAMVRAGDLRYILANPAYQAIPGADGGPMVGRTVSEVFPHLTEARLEPLRAAIRTGRPMREAEVEAAMGPGRERSWWTVEHVPIPDGSGGVRAVLILAREVTEAVQARARAEAAAFDAERRAREAEEGQRILDAIMEHAPEGITIADAPDVRIRRVSRYGRELTGRPAEMLEGIRGENDTQAIAWGIYHPGGERRALDEELPLTRAVKRGEISTGEEWVLRRPDGSQVSILTNAGPIRDAQGTITGGVIAWRDITERIRAEEQLRRNHEKALQLAEALREAKRLAEQGSQAKSQFLAVMSHELRTPLTGVIGFADLLETGVLGPLTDRQSEAIARITASSWHLIGIIDEILTLSRVEAGKEEVRRSEVDVAAIARDVAEIIGPDAAARGLELRCRGVDEPARIHTDPGKVRQILINLVGNAAKYTREGSITVRLDRAGDEALLVHVEDTGPGIAPEYQEAVFEPFTQADSSHTRTDSGTGLGLAICRRLALLLGGAVTLRSTPGDGCTFTLRLPTRPPDPDEPVPAGLPPA